MSWSPLDRLLRNKQCSPPRTGREIQRDDKDDDDGDDDDGDDDDADDDDDILKGTGMHLFPVFYTGMIYCSSFMLPGGTRIIRTI